MVCEHTYELVYELMLTNLIRCVRPLCLPQVVVMSTPPQVVVIESDNDKWAVPSLVLAVGAAVVSLFVAGMVVVMYRKMSKRASELDGVMERMTSRLPQTVMVAPAGNSLKNMGEAHGQVVTGVAVRSDGHVKLQLPLVA